jgi:PEP-CTERM motif
MSPMSRVRFLLLSAFLIACVAHAFGNSVPPPFDLTPFDARGIGPSAANYDGSFRMNGSPPQFRLFIGTGGSLVLSFNKSFTNGPGNDFAILTNSQGWQAPANNSALFQFFMGGSLEASFAVTLAPDQLFQFDLPGNNFVANRVVVTNLTSGDMTFDDAGAAHAIGRSLVPEPSTLVMLGTGLVGVLGAARRKLRP